MKISRSRPTQLHVKKISVKDLFGQGELHMMQVAKPNLWKEK